MRLHSNPLTFVLDMFLTSRLQFPHLLPRPAMVEGRGPGDTRPGSRGRSGRCLGAAVVSGDRAEQGYRARSTSGLRQGPRSIQRWSARRLYGWRAGRTTWAGRLGQDDLHVAGRKPGSGWTVRSSVRAGLRVGQRAAMSSRVRQQRPRPGAGWRHLASGTPEIKTTSLAPREVSGVPRHLGAAELARIHVLRRSPPLTARSGRRSPAPR